MRGCPALVQRTCHALWRSLDGVPRPESGDVSGDDPDSPGCSGPHGEYGNQTHGDDGQHKRWGSGAKMPCRVGREVSHPGPSPDPDKEISTIRLFRRCDSWLYTVCFR
jgi:hypothetical protein